MSELESILVETGYTSTVIFWWDRKMDNHHRASVCIDNIPKVEIYLEGFSSPIPIAWYRRSDQTYENHMIVNIAVETVDGFGDLKNILSLDLTELKAYMEAISRIDPA
jgi:hypothetical protein